MHRITLLKSNKENILEDSESAKVVLNILDNYFGRFEELDLISKRTLVRLLVSSAYSDGENLVVNLIGTNDTVKEFDFPCGEDSK